MLGHVAVHRKPGSSKAGSSRVDSVMQRQAQPTVPNPVSGGFAHDFSQVPVFATRSDQDADLPVCRAPLTRAVFAFQTFIPDKYVPGTGVLGYGDNRGFGKPGDSYRTYQQITIETERALNEVGVEGEPIAKTGESETAVPGFSGTASANPLHMAAKRRDAHSMMVTFDGSIQNGAFVVGSLSPAIDFSGAIAISNATGKLQYGLFVKHDAFPAYEAFLNEQPIYRWSYPAESTVADLVGSGTAITGIRKTAEAPGGIIGAPKFQDFGGGSSGGGGSGGEY
jgi:uncharacterized membrane protein YgcG